MQLNKAKFSGENRIQRLVEKTVQKFHKLTNRAKLKGKAIFSSLKTQDRLAL